MCSVQLRLRLTIKAVYEGGPFLTKKSQGWIVARTTYTEIPEQASSGTLSKPTCTLDSGPQMR